MNCNSYNYVNDLLAITKGLLAIFTTILGTSW